MSSNPNEASGYTTNLGRSRGFAGWGVECREHLALDEHDTKPYATEGAAAERLSVIEDAGFCSLPHAIVKVYRTRPGKRAESE